MTAIVFTARAPKDSNDVTKGDEVWVVNSFGANNKSRRRAKVFDVLRRACVLESIEGRNSGEKMTVPFNGLELMDPAEQAPSAPAHRAWLKQKEKEQEKEQQREQQQRQAEQRQQERRQPPPPTMPTVVRRPSSEPLRAVPPALQNIAETVSVPKPVPQGPPSMLSWAEQGLQMNIQAAHALEDRIGEIDADIEKLKATIADEIARMEAKKKVEQEKLAQTRLMIETIEAQINTLKAS